MSQIGNCISQEKRHQKKLKKKKEKGMREKMQIQV